jgi:hypothetical protein
MWNEVNCECKDGTNHPSAGRVEASAILHEIADGNTSRNIYLKEMDRHERYEKT